MSPREPEPSSAARLRPRWTIDGDVTRAKVEALASEWSDDPATVVEVVHDGFNADARSGGYAFVCDRGLLVYDVTGDCTWSIEPGDDASQLAGVERYWREARHRNRHLELADVSEWHRAAIAALEAGISSVGDLPPQARRGIDDLARADYLLVVLRRRATEPTKAAALRTIAKSDHLLEIPHERNRAHPCPICGLPAIGEHRQAVSVCDGCYPKTVCADGRVVTGHIIRGGLFEARHADDESVCKQVTDDGRVWINARQCELGEARFGGVDVCVEAEPE